MSVFSGSLATRGVHKDVRPLPPCTGPATTLLEVSWHEGKPIVPQYGRGHKGARKVYKAQKRVEAEARNARTPDVKRRAFRTQSLEESPADTLARGRFSQHSKPDALEELTMRLDERPEWDE